MPKINLHVVLEIHKIHKFGAYQCKCTLNITYFTILQTCFIKTSQEFFLSFYYSLKQNHLLVTIILIIIIYKLTDYEYNNFLVMDIVTYLKGKQFERIT